MTESNRQDLINSQEVTLNCAPGIITHGLPLPRTRRLRDSI